VTAARSSARLLGVTPRWRWIAVALCACWFALGCEDHLPGAKPNPSATGTQHARDAGMRPAPEKVDLTGLTDVDIRFELHAGGAKLGCGSDAVEVGQPKTAVTLADARLYISEPRLIDDAGHAQTVVLKPDGEYQQSKVALLDFEDATGACALGTPDTHEVLHGAVKPGTYRGLAFVVGVPESVNHDDPTLAYPPLDVQPMHWDWTEGYRFLRLDLALHDDVTVEMHLGSTACDADARGDVQCEQSNRPAVMIDDFDPDSQVVVLDLDVMLADWDLAQDAPDCIAGAQPAPCGPMFESLGLDPKTGDANANRQTAFRAAAHSTR
jgi:uncharacterized repeat protein (TIGR04052 family)